MSRIGKLPVAIPEGVQIDLNASRIVVKGKMGELSAQLSDDVKVTQEVNNIIVKPANDSKRSRALWGTIRNLINNIVIGVVSGFTIRLEISGVGYRAQADNKFLTLNLGFSHEIKYAIPSDITIKCEKPTIIVISGANKQKVGQVAGEIMKFRPVEPYKGKGIYIEGSYIRRKEGKKK